MKKYRPTVTAQTLAFALIALGGRPALADPVDDYLRAELQKRHIPGLSLAVLKDGEVVKTAGYGLANVELNVPATPRTVFQIQSITKTFTSAAILLLSEEGKLSLDDPVAKHLEGAPGSWKAITIRHLLSHTSGIKDFINDPTVSLRLEVTEEEVLQATAPRPLNFAPGEKYAYSNTNYHLLAMVIRKLTGKWYGDFLRERIFEPLGMSRTRVVSLSEVIPDRATGYHWRKGAFVNGDFVAESVLAYGGGGIVSTAPDLARWAASFETEKLLKPKTIEEAWTPFKLNDGSAATYGLGWFIQPAEGHRGVGHSGGHVTGFTSHLAIYPADRLAVVVLTNSTSADPAPLARNIAARYVSALAARPRKPLEDREPQVTALLRDCLVRASRGELQAEMFTAELWKAISESGIAGKEMAQSRGALQSVDLLERTKAHDLPTYRYRATFAHLTLGITLSLNAGGQIAFFSYEEE
jgi:D-alanyl-D-alanine carboxypeptidase